MVKNSAPFDKVLIQVKHANKNRSGYVLGFWYIMWEVLVINLYNNISLNGCKWNLHTLGGKELAAMYMQL